jgi:hypothetical protein
LLLDNFQLIFEKSEKTLELIQLIADVIIAGKDRATVGTDLSSPATVGSRTADHPQPSFFSSIPASVQSEKSDLSEKCRRLTVLINLKT